MIGCDRTAATRSKFQHILRFSQSEPVAASAPDQDMAAFGQGRGLEGELRDRREPDAFAEFYS